MIIRIEIQSLLSCKKHSCNTHHSYVYVNSICIYAKYMHIDYIYIYICESEVA